MAPATLTSRDDFNRANGPLTTGYAAHAVLSGTIARVISNQCGVTTAYTGFVRTAESLGNDQGVAFKWATLGSDTLGVWIRGTGLDLDNATTQGLGVYLNMGSNYVGLWRYTKAGGYVALHEPTYPAADIAAGSVVQIEVIGSTVTIYDDGAVWCALNTGGSIPSGAQIGFEFQATDIRVDDLATGTIVSAVNLPIGGAAGGGVAPAPAAARALMQGAAAGGGFAPSAAVAVSIARGGAAGGATSPTPAAARGLPAGAAAAAGQTPVVAASVVLSSGGASAAGRPPAREQTSPLPAAPAAGRTRTPTVAATPNLSSNGANGDGVTPTVTANVSMPSGAAAGAGRAVSSPSGVVLPLGGAAANATSPTVTAAVTLTTGVSTANGRPPTTPGGTTPLPAIDQPVVAVLDPHLTNSTLDAQTVSIVLDAHTRNIALDPHQREAALDG